MIINTKHFGELEVDEQKIINFKNGLPGFEQQKQFVLLTKEELTNGPFYWLQSVEDGNVAFALVNPFVFYNEYSPDVPDEMIEHLGYTSEEDLSVYAVTVVPNDIKKMTVNLKAPIIINSKTQKGVQVIANNMEYGTRHFIYDEINLFTKHN